MTEALIFLLWPFLACVALILIHAYFGIHILERGILFVDIALAQFIGVGIALSFIFGHENPRWRLIWKRARWLRQHQKR